MKRMILAANCIVMMAVGASVLSTAQATPTLTQPHQEQDAKATQDILYLLDGRILHGKLLDETYSTYLFQYIDSRLSLTTEMSIPKADVVKIDRDVPVADSGADAAHGENDMEESSPTSTAAEYSAEKMKEKYGATLATEAEGVPSFYIVPMKGQMGTDVIMEVYEEVVEDIRRAQPDMVVFVLECNETSEGFYIDGFEGPKPPEEWGLLEIDEYKALVELLRVDLRDVPQVMWIGDSEGISSMVAMAWDQIYMAPRARLGGLITLLRQTAVNRHPDPHIRAKFMSAMIGGAKAFLEVGGYDQDLAEAMLNPEHHLSGAWKGRSVDWVLDGSGEVVVDTSNQHTTDFRAKDAEDYGISRGTAETMDDLAILLGYREYRLLPGTGVEIIEDYIEDWRRAFKAAHDKLLVYQENAGAGDLVSLTRARTALRDVQGLVKRYEAVERRLLNDFGWDSLSMQILEEQLTESIAAASRNRNRGGGRSSGGGGGRLGSGGGGGGLIDD